MDFINLITEVVQINTKRRYVVFMYKIRPDDTKQIAFGKS